MEYRILLRSEIELLRQINRGESVEQIYYIRDDQLVLEEEHWDVPDWPPDEKTNRIRKLQEQFDEGAVFYGAFAGQELAGMGFLTDQPISSGDARLNLKGLWVSRPYRKQGVGRMLVRLMEQEAREKSAKAVYISSTPSKNTVQFYFSLGYELTKEVDPNLFAEEPEDIHLERKL